MTNAEREHKRYPAINPSTRRFKAREGITLQTKGVKLFALIDHQR